MLYIKNPNENVREMKALAESLTPYTPPKHPKDEDISWLKSRDIIVDGVSMVVHYSVSDHGDLKPCLLTIGCKNVPFIPFTIVCKVARMFLGTENLTLFEYTKGGSKIYSWMVLLRKGKPVEHFNAKADKVNHHGFDFYRCDTSKEQEVTPNLSDIE